MWSLLRPWIIVCIESRLRAWLRHRRPFLQQLSRHIGFIYIVQNELSSKFPVIIQYNKKLFSKFLCEEDKFLSISIKNGFAFPTKSLRAISVAFINPPFCVETIFYWNEIGASILYWFYGCIGEVHTTIYMVVYISRRRLQYICLWRQTHAANKDD